MCSIIIHVLVILSPWILVSDAAAPVCSPDTYSISVGINTTENTDLQVVMCTDGDGDAITYSVDPASNGGSYFGFNGSTLILATRLDVEYGLPTWSILIFAVDDSATPQTGTATISVTPYQSTTTTTTTPAPPGYDWFGNQYNVILFGGVLGYFALMTAFCIMMCWRFHRVGTCLPKSCPEYGKCRASFKRQCTCCPIPCDFYNTVDKEDQTTIISEASPLPPPQTTTNFYLGEKEESHVSTTEPTLSPVEERAHVVSPVIIGNVRLFDVGFDGMRSPGFNAPMQTSYGGAIEPLTVKKGRRRH